MKRLLVLILLSIGFTNVSFAEVIVPGWIEADTMEKMCKKMNCSLLKDWYSYPHGDMGVIDAYKKEYFTKQPNKTFVISTSKNGVTYFIRIKKSKKEPELALNWCKNSFANCKVLFVNNQIYDKAFYKQLMSSTTSTSIDIPIDIPKNAKASSSSFMCNHGYFKNKSKTLCLRVPANAKKTSNDLFYACNTGYKKSANKCIKKINKLVVPSYRN